MQREVVPLGFHHPSPHYFQPIPLPHPITQETLAKLSSLAPMLQGQPLCPGTERPEQQPFPEPTALFSSHTAEGEWVRECDSVRGDRRK